MAPTLYIAHLSPPVRTVLITVKAIGLQYNEKEVDLSKGEHLTPEYLKINPQHTVPTLVEDDGFTLSDSHAIATYLISKYAKNDSLYPKDLKKRAIVDQRLHFESGVMFARLRRITKPIALHGRTTIYDEDRDNVVEAYGFLELFLEGQEWVAGDFLSVADYSLFTSVSSISTLVPIDPQKFPNVTAWLKKVESLPECEVNKRGLEELSVLLHSRLNKTD